VAGKGAAAVNQKVRDWSSVSAGERKKQESDGGGGGRVASKEPPPGRGRKSGQHIGAKGSRQEVLSCPDVPSTGSRENGVWEESARPLPIENDSVGLRRPSVPLLSSCCSAVPVLSAACSFAAGGACLRLSALPSPPASSLYPAHFLRPQPSPSSAVPALASVLHAPWHLPYPLHPPIYPGPSPPPPSSSSINLPLPHFDPMVHSSKDGYTYYPNDGGLQSGLATEGAIRPLSSFAAKKTQKFDTIVIGAGAPPFRSSLLPIAHSDSLNRLRWSRRCP
jgi:hypothetical protein